MARSEGGHEVCDACNGLPSLRVPGREGLSALDRPKGDQARGREGGEEGARAPQQTVVSPTTVLVPVVAESAYGPVPLVLPPLWKTRTTMFTGEAVGFTQ
jgi:hypothetical protein